MIPSSLPQQTQWEPIIPPDEVAFWPPQPGWYAVLLLLMAVGIYLGYRYARRRKANHYRRLALTELDRMKVDEPDLNELNHLLKAVAIKTYGRETVAGLHGKSWLEFLNRSSPKSQISKSFEQIGFGFYTSEDKNSIPSDQWTDLIQTAMVWTKSHKTS